MPPLNAARTAGTSTIAESVADQVLNAADTYVLGSTLPFSGFEERVQIKWRLWMNKTAAGVAAPSFKIRVGTLATVADAAKVTLVGPVQTAVVDTAFVEIVAILRTAGATAAATLAAILRMQHNLDSTGFAVTGTPTIEAVSAGFDSTIKGQLIGLSIDPGAAGVWTVRGVTAEIIST